jgi:hypothetical protein
VRKRPAAEGGAGRLALGRRRSAAAPGSGGMSSNGRTDR